MVVTCQACGAESHDLEFCDHCNADLTSAAPPPAPRVCRLGNDQALYLSAEQVRALSRPEAAVTLQTPDRNWRLHWIGRALWPSWRPQVGARLRCRCAALPSCRLVEEPDGVWLIAEAQAARVEPWAKLPAADPFAEVERVLTFMERLGDALDVLEAAGLIWLTFDPQEIEEHGGRLRFTNLDLAAYPLGSCPDPLPARTAFAAPEICRFHAGDFNARTDVFHLAIFAYYWLARRLPGGFVGQGLESFAYALPPLRVFAPNLPPGIASVLSRGLSVEPQQRQARPSDLVAELRQALSAARARQASTVPVAWDIGWHSRTGRSKFVLDRPNEDDHCLTEFDAPRRLFAAVADGISTCSIGNGAIASHTTCAVLERLVDADCRLLAFQATLEDACRQASQGLLDWALENGHREDLMVGSDLMGTTLTAAWLEGNQLAVGNLGDSRAYLVTQDGAEQLTVDDDLASALLMMGMPPEEVRAFGSMGRSLRKCVGGSVRVDGEELFVNEEYCRPGFTAWTLLPGDLIVLCTDGLVDEGVFLEPQQMVELIHRHADLPAEALAIKLADAADALQRLPSTHEPDGFGDNITCIVIKIVRSP